MAREVCLCRYRKGGDGKPKPSCEKCKKLAEKPKGKGER